MSDTADPQLGMTAVEFAAADQHWLRAGDPEHARRPLSCMMPTDDSLGELVRLLDAVEDARRRLRELFGRVRWTYGGWDAEHVAWVSEVPDGTHLAHREFGYWEASRTRDLRWFEPLDDAAREILAFVALQIERDHHLRDLERYPRHTWEPPRDAHLRHLRAFLATRTTADTTT